MNADSAPSTSVCLIQSLVAVPSFCIFSRFIYSVAVWLHPKAHFPSNKLVIREIPSRSNGRYIHFPGFLLDHQFELACSRQTHYESMTRKMKSKVEAIDYNPLEEAERKGHLCLTDTRDGIDD